jgi:hypothetical protein
MEELPMERSITLHEGELSPLVSAAKWTKYLSILGFVGIGLYALIFIFLLFAVAVAGPRASAEMIPALIIIPIFIGLYIAPVISLYKFSSKTIEGVQFMNKEILLHAFDQLRSHFRYVGILTIVMIGLYVLIIILAIVAGIAAAL